MADTFPIHPISEYLYGSKIFDNWPAGGITFEHRKCGTLKSGEFKGEKFNETLHFQYNKSGNLTKFIYDFSFGETQTDTFTYKNLYDFR